MNAKHTPNHVAERSSLTHEVAYDNWSEPDFIRAEACVSALAGIADPEAAIKGAGNALHNVHCYLKALNEGTLNGGTGFEEAVSVLRSVQRELVHFNKRDGK